MTKKNKSQNKLKCQFLFGKRNYKIMIIGIIIIAVGFILMAGGDSPDVNHFNKAIFDFRRIRLAPTLVLIGLGFQIFAILANPIKK